MQRVLEYILLSRWQFMLQICLHMMKWIMGFSIFFSLPVTKKDYVREKIYFQHFSGCSSLVTWSDNNNRSFNDRKLRNGSEKIGNDNVLGDDGRSRSYCIEHTGTIKILTVKRGRLIIAVIVLFLGGAGVLTGKMCGRLGVNPTGIFQKIVSLSAGQLLGAGMMILVIGLTVSYQCNIKILEKKEY